MRDLGLFAFCIDFEPNYLVLKGSAEAITRKMHGLLELYTDRNCRDVVESASALCLNDISAFFSVLKPSHSETNDQVGQVRLVPGRISFEGKSYMHLVDRKMQATDELTARDGSLTRPDCALTAQDHFTQRLLSVREGPVDLHCLMEFTRDVGADGKFSVLSVGPFAFAQTCLRHAGDGFTANHYEQEVGAHSQQPPRSNHMAWKESGLNTSAKEE